MLGNFIDFRLFFISLALGLFLVYITQSTSTIIYVYPTPKNINHIQYQDKTNNCFNLESTEVKCPSDKSKIHSIPIQDRKNNII